MTQKHFILPLLFLCSSLIAQAQIDHEKYGADYIFIGKGSSNSGGDVSFEKYDFRASFPKKLEKPGSKIFHKLNYSKTNIDYGIIPLTGTELEHFHSIAYTFGFSKPLKNGWYLTTFISPNISSNFESSISFSELRLFGMALFSKAINKKKNLILNLGALYSSTIGFPAPIPVASLMWKPDPRWVINFGFPQFDINYQATTSLTIGTSLFMSGENFTLTDDIVYDGNNTKIDNVSIMNIGGGLYLNKKITKIIKLNVNSGYTFYRNFEFKDGNDSVHDFNLDNNFYIKAGISIGL